LGTYSVSVMAVSCLCFTFTGR